LELVSQVEQATTLAGYRSAVASLLREWGNGSNHHGNGKQAFSYAFGFVLGVPADAQNAECIVLAVKGTWVMAARVRPLSGRIRFPPNRGKHESHCRNVGFSHFARLRECRNRAIPIQKALKDS
jgi:hypothetical protein